MSDIQFDKWLDELQKVAPEKHQKLIQWLTKYKYLVSHEQDFNYAKIPSLKRGQIIFLNFGYRIHNEFRYPHYAVVLRKSPKHNHNVTVVPITSKKHSHQIDIGYELQKQLENTIFKQEFTHCHSPLKKLASKLEKHGVQVDSIAIGTSDQVSELGKIYIEKIQQQLDKDDSLRQDLDAILTRLQKYDCMMKKLPNLDKHSYLVPEQITTVSKSRIIHPVDPTHIFNHLRISDSILNELDSELIKLYTGKNGKQR